MAKKNFYDKNKTMIWVGAIAIVIVGLIVANNLAKPDYPDIYNEKPAKGAPDAPVTLVEFSDFQCPACKQAYFTTERILEDYEGDVKLEYKHFPLRSIHPYAQISAEASECANDQGMFWEYVDVLFTNSPELTKRDLKAYASQLGLDESFDACLDSRAKQPIVDADYREATGLGLRGTPTFFVNGEQVEYLPGLSLYDNLKNAIDAELS